MKPLISIIIPVHNADKYLSACLESVIGQTYKKLEIICIDDGSNDSSRQICDQYAHKDKRIIVRSQPNSGQGTARNLGLTLASGDYVMFVDADDQLLPTACRELAKIIDMQQLDVIAFDYNKVYNEFRIPMHKFTDIDDKLLNCPISAQQIFKQLCWWSREPWFMIYRRVWLQDNLVRFTDTKMWEDFYFRNCLIVANPQMYLYDQPLYDYVQHNDSTSRTCSQFWQQFLQVFWQSLEVLFRSSLSSQQKETLLTSDLHWFHHWCELFSPPYKKWVNLGREALLRSWAIRLKFTGDDYFASILIKQYEPLWQKFKRHNSMKKIQVNSQKVNGPCLPDPSLSSEPIGWAKVIMPIDRLRTDAVSVCLSANDHYFEYLYICLFSMRKHCDKNAFYDIVILEKDLARHHQEKIKTLTTENFSIRFYNILEIMDSCKVNFPVHAHFSVEAYFRLFIPYVFRRYQNVVYSDCDGVYLNDIKEIFEQDLDGMAIGACRDYIILNKLYCAENCQYYFHKLGLKNPFHYINSGIMKIDIQCLLNLDFLNNSLNFLYRIGQPSCVDQCVINKVLEEKIKFFDNNLNSSTALEDLVNSRRQKIRLPSDLWREYKRSLENPVFVHYMSHLKPWRYHEISSAHYFWELAKEAGMYEQVLYKNLK